ncbi:MAG TPA: ABC transporter permease [Candidatus Angelobacter sp.]|nr:ABC transporter permease [Candidatus Angelobacter sp.]
MHDLRYAIRALKKTPGFTLVAVITLALGIGANTAIFSVVQRVLLRPLPYPEPEKLVEIWNTYPPYPRAGLSPGDYADWRAWSKSFSEMGAYAEISTGFNLTGDAEPQRIQAGYASASLFPMLGAQAVAGRSFLPEEDRAGSAPVVMLSHRLWQSRFGGDPHIVGRPIILDDRRYIVAGVLPAGFNFLRWADLWLPIGQYYDDLTSHVHHDFVVIGRLKPKITLAQARDEITRFNEQELIAFPTEHKGFGVQVQRLEDPSATKLRSTLLVLFGAVGLVLLIACANVVNLLLVRNAAREREIAVRTALGANPWHLIRQLLTESAVLSLSGSVLGLAIAVAGLKILNRFIPSDLAVPASGGLSGMVLAFTFTLSVVVAFACGLLPALRTLKTNLVGVLKQGSKGTSARGRHRTHSALVISEVGMALLVLAGAGLLLRSFKHLIEVDPGFRTDHVLIMEVPQANLSFAESNRLSVDEQAQLTRRQGLEFEQIAEQIRALPGVKEVGGISDLPLGTELRSASRFVIEGQPAVAAGARPIAQIRAVSLSYFASLGIPLRAGRLLTEEDWKQITILINETMAQRYWPAGDAIGKRINLCSLAPKPCWFSIVGVVGNVHQFGLDASPTFDVYIGGGWTPNFVIRTTTDPDALVAAITSVVHKVDAKLPVSHVMTMDELMSDSVSQRRISTNLVGVFALLALALAAVGIFGVLSYTVSQRTQEIGIRMAVGAQSGDVQRMVLGQTAKLTVIGIALGLLGSVGLARFLATLLFGVSAYDPVTLLGVAGLLMLVALAAAWVPARRAVRVDPLIALRCE